MDDTRHIEEQHYADALNRKIAERRCRAKHTKFQPRFHDQWECFVCGGDNEWVSIDENDEKAGEYCELLHDEDIVRCYLCHNEWRGEVFAAEMAKKFGDEEWVPTVDDLLEFGRVRDWVGIRGLHILREFKEEEEEEFELLRVVLLEEDMVMEIQYRTPGIHCDRTMSVPIDVFVGPWKLWCKQQKEEIRKVRRQGRRGWAKKRINEHINGLSTEQMEQLVEQIINSESSVL